MGVAAQQKRPEWVALPLPRRGRSPGLARGLFRVSTPQGAKALTREFNGPCKGKWLKLHTCRPSGMAAFAFARVCGGAKIKKSDERAYNSPAMHFLRLTTARDKCTVTVTRDKCTVTVTPVPRAELQSAFMRAFAHELRQRTFAKHVVSSPGFEGHGTAMTRTALGGYRSFAGASFDQLVGAGEQHG